jgi:hypothetical protein
MTKSLSGKAAVAAATLLLFTAAALAHLNLVPPFAAIEYNSAQAQTLHGTPEAFSKDTPILLHDVTASDGTYWLAGSVRQLTTLRGYAHVGTYGLGQSEANGRITLIQIWGWLDTNGNGAADDGDATTLWVKLVELKPSQNGGNGSGGNVVGYQVEDEHPLIHTSTWRGDLLQGHAIQLAPGESWLLLIRVVDISGNTSLMTYCQGLERWDNGAADGIGSDVAADRYVDCNGNTPGTTNGRIQDDDVVWVYVPRLK